MKEKVNYVDKQKFKEALSEHKKKVNEAKEKGLPKPKPCDYIGECLLKIAQNYTKHSWFNRFTFKDEMVDDAVENAIMYLDNFDPDRGTSAFAYFTQISKWAFARRIQKEKDQQYLKYKSAENFGVLGEEELMELSEIDDTFRNQTQIYDNMYEFIEKYENARMEKKLKQKANVKPKGLELFYEDE